TVLAFNVLGDGVRDAFGVDAVRRRRKGTAGITRVVPAVPGADAGGTSSPPSAAPPGALPAVRGPSGGFETEQGVHRVVENVSLHVRPGEILGLVGESGSGKTVTSLSILRLIPSPPGSIVGGSIRFDGQDLLQADFETVRRVRGADIAMV